MNHTSIPCSTFFNLATRVPMARGAVLLPLLNDTKAALFVQKHKKKVNEFTTGTGDKIGLYTEMQHGVSGLPDPEPGMFYLVRKNVAQRVRRSDVGYAITKRDYIGGREVNRIVRIICFV